MFTGEFMDQEQFYRAKLYYEIDSWDLSEAMQDAEKVVVVDARSKDAHEREHIPTAISLPHRTMTQETTKHLDKTKLYVIYCDGIGCNASTKGALNLLVLGFTVKELLGGLDWWKRDGYPTSGTAGSKGGLIACSC